MNVNQDVDEPKQEIKEVQEDPLYSAMTYEIKTQTQQENELLKLDK